MRWTYKIIFKNSRFYQYSYSRENTSEDGIIQYDVEKQSAVVIKPCSFDQGKPRALKRAIDHFYKVVSEGFPDVVNVCCG